MKKSTKSLFDKQNKYSIRKLTVGTCSVIIGSLLFGSGQIYAQESEYI